MDESKSNIGKVVFWMMLAFGLYHLIFHPEDGPTTRAFSVGVGIVGAIGILVLTFWKKKGGIPQEKWTQS